LKKHEILSSYPYYMKFISKRKQIDSYSKKN